MSDDGKAGSTGGHVFAGEPDGRLSTSPGEKVSRFRRRYRQLTEAEKTFHDEAMGTVGDLVGSAWQASG